MNKFFTLKLTENERQLNPDITDQELLEKSEQGIKTRETPSENVIDFLLSFSKSLEAQNGYSYQLN